MSNFIVRVDRMVESHRVTYWVMLYNMNQRPVDAKIWDREGKITPYYSEYLERAIETAKDWAKFLGVEADIYDVSVQK